MRSLKKGVLAEGHIVQTWVARRILPLQAQSSLMSQYTWPKDPVRVCQEELGAEAIDALLSALVGPDAITRSRRETVQPFTTDLLPGSVSTSFTIFTLSSGCRG